MTDTTSIPLFLGSVIAISLTGAMMPGPVTAVTITKGAQRRSAGLLVAFGHGVLELPLIVLIYFGLARFLDFPEVRIAVAVVGGAMLLWMALNTLRAGPLAANETKELPHSTILAGLATTAASPYFFIWWATIGAALIASAREFGGAGVAAMGLAHWLCDFGWLFLISWVVFKSKRLWTPRVDRAIAGASAAILGGFGVWFIVSGVQFAL
ncbi:MAG: LysE family transporter [Dehalococcoidia bacterium]|nr:LysE family transporter [Dehalococcoidia bacterium]